MEGADEPPRQAPTPVGKAVRFEAHASGQARIYQAVEDIHLHYEEGGRAKPGTAAEECPYPGLAAFGRAQARWFFGREQLTAELIALLDGRLRTGGVQAVVAPSGAGKSSLLHAGLLPKLGNGALPGPSEWPTVVFTPTAQPLQALAIQIGALTGADPVSMAEQFMADSQRAEAVPRDRIRDVDPGTRLVMVVDQFEELFTLCTDDRQRRTFIELLAQLADPRSADTPSIGLVVIGIRADFCAACLNYSHLRTALQENPLVVGPMSDTELRAAILYPAQDMRLSIEPGLIDLLLRELGTTAGESGFVIYEAGRLPLLAHALQATWQQRNDHTLTIAGYQATGGIHRAVATTAEHLFADLDSTGQTVARTLFLRLIKIGDDTEDTRRRMVRTDLLQGLPSGSPLAVLDAFTEGRLLTQEQDTVEITHEALLRVWPRLRQWIDTDRAGNLTRQELEEAAAVWERKDRDSAELYRGRRLEEAHTWASSSSDEGDPSPAVTAFLTASTHQEHRSTRLRRTALIMLSVLALVASGAAVIASRQSASAEQQRDNAIVNRIVANADQLRSTDVSLAAQLDLTAYRMRPKNPELYTKLLTTENAVLSTPPLTGHTDSVFSVAFSPDRRTLASAGVDKTVRRWDVRDPAHPAPLGQPLTGHSDWVRSVAFSPNGRVLASAGSDRTVRLWNLTDPAHPAPLGQPLTGHDGSVSSVAFSPDGRTLASAGTDQTIRLWDLTDPAHPTSLGGPLTGHTKAVNSVVFSPDRHTLASAGEDHTVRLWDITDPAHPASLGQPFTAQRGTVVSVAFSPDGHTLASAGDDQTVRLWNLADPAHPARLSQPIAGHTNAVWSVAFSPDGRTLASASTDRTVRLWSIPDTVLTGHSEYVTSVAFSPDGHTLASASTDHTVRLWDLTNPAHPRALGQPLPGYTTHVWSVAFSPDGRTLATGNGSGNIDYTVRLWDLTDPTHPRALSQPLIGHIDSVVSVAFSPDGRTLASASNDHNVRLWNLTDLTHPAQLGRPLTGHTRQVVSVAFSPDGRTLASAGLDRKVWLWNLTDPAHPRALGQPLGHTNAVLAVAFSPDGRTLASAGYDQTVRLWNLTDPAHPAPLGQPLTGHTNAVLAVAFSPDRHTLASAGYDQTVRLWDVTDPAHPALLGQPLIGHTSVVTSVRFSPDGNTLASAGYGNDSTVRLWGMNEDQAIQRICGTTGNTLTQAKWEQYVSKDLTYAPPCPR